LGAEKGRHGHFGNEFWPRAASKARIKHRNT
jgi:hypothetical protein